MFPSKLFTLGSEFTRFFEVHLNFSHFLSHNDGITLGYLLRSHGLVVELALVLVAVSVYGAEEATAPAGEPSQSQLLLAHAAPVLLLLAVLASVLLARGPGDGRGLRGRLLGLWLWLRPQNRNCGLGGL